MSGWRAGRKWRPNSRDITKQAHMNDDSLVCACFYRKEPMSDTATKATLLFVWTGWVMVECAPYFIYQLQPVLDAAGNVYRLLNVGGKPAGRRNLAKADGNDPLVIGFGESRPNHGRDERKLRLARNLRRPL
ncbi:hypothetical protein PALU110988_09395 [Paenibacillus lupini]